MSIETMRSKGSKGSLARQPAERGRRTRADRGTGEGSDILGLGRNRKMQERAREAFFAQFEQPGASVRVADFGVRRGGFFGQSGSGRTKLLGN
jgi:hypothetical protein